MEKALATTVVDDLAKIAEISTFKHPLGAAAIDQVTGFAGTIIGRTEWTTGCRQYCLAPRVGDDGAYRESQWFDEDRLTITGQVYGRQPVEADAKPAATGGPAPARTPVK